MNPDSLEYSSLCFEQKRKNAETKRISSSEQCRRLVVLGVPGAGRVRRARRRAGQACPAPGGTGGPGAGQHGAGFDGPASPCETISNALMWLYSVRRMCCHCSV